MLPHRTTWRLAASKTGKGVDEMTELEHNHHRLGYHSGGGKTGRPAEQAANSLATAA